MSILKDFLAKLRGAGYGVSQLRPEPHPGVYSS
jgi:hypothetical protein